MATGFLLYGGSTQSSSVLGLTPKMKGAMPVIDFAVGRTSPNPTSIAYCIDESPLYNFSSSSIAITTGTVNWTVNQIAFTGSFPVGYIIKIASKSVPTAFMQGTVTSYTNGTLTINVDTVGTSSGTYNDWYLVQYASLLTNFSNTSVSIAKGNATWNVNTGVYSGTFISGLTVKLASQSAPTKAYVIGTVVSYTNGSLTLNVTTLGPTTGSFSDWCLAQYLPANYAIGSSFIAIKATASPQTITDWDFTNLTYSLNLQSGTGTSPITINQCVFEQATLTKGQAGLFASNYTQQPYIITNTTIKNTIIYKPITATSTSVVSPNTIGDATIKSLTLDNVPSQVQANPTQYLIYNNTSKASIALVGLSSATSTTVTLLNDTSDDPFVISPILDTVNIGDQICFIKKNNPPGAIAGGTCIEFSNNYVESANDVFFILSGYNGQQTKIFNNYIVMYGYSGAHADLFQMYGWSQGPGLRFNNNIVKTVTIPGINKNGNPREMLQYGQHYPFSGIWEFDNNILDASGTTTFTFYLGQETQATQILALLPDTTEIRAIISTSYAGSAGYYNSGDPIQIGGLTTYSQLNSHQATIGTAYCDPGGLYYTCNSTIRTTQQVSAQSTVIPLAVTTGILVGSTFTTDSGGTGTLYTVQSISGTSLTISPALTTSLANNALLYFTRSFIIANSNSNLLTSPYIPTSVTLYPNKSSAASTNIVSFNDVSNIAVGMLVASGSGYSKGNCYVASVDSTGNSITLSRPLYNAVSTTTAFVFRAYLRVAKTGLTSIHDNYFALPTNNVYRPADTGVKSGSDKVGIYSSTQPYYGFVEPSNCVASATTLYNNKIINKNSSDLFTNVGDTITFSYLKSDTYISQGQIQATSGNNMVSNVSSLNPPCVAPSSITVTKYGNIIKLNYQSDVNSLGEIYSLDNGTTWSDAASLITSGSVINFGSASSIILVSMNAVDDFGVPRNFGATSSIISF